MYSRCAREARLEFRKTAECKARKNTRYEINRKLIPEGLLARALKEVIKVVGPNVYAEDNPSEFDLLFVDVKASPKEYMHMASHMMLYMRFHVI